MDYKILESFVHTIEDKSFSKAAERLYLSQSSVSLYIKALEKELETQLVYRTSKEVMPTKAGMIFYEYAKNVLHLRENMFTNIKHLQSIDNGTLKIYASSVPAQCVLPKMIPPFSLTNPNIAFEIFQTNSREVVQKIIAQEGDFGIVGAQIIEPKCSYEYFFTEELTLVSAYDKFSKQGCYPLLGLIYTENFVAREKGSGTRMIYEAFFKSHNIHVDKIKNSYVFSNTESVLHAVHKGLGVAIVSKTAAKDYLAQKAVREIKTDIALPKRDFYFVFKNNLILLPHVKHFCQYLIRNFS